MTTKPQCKKIMRNWLMKHNAPGTLLSWCSAKLACATDPTSVCRFIAKNLQTFCHIHTPVHYIMTSSGLEMTQRRQGTYPQWHALAASFTSPQLHCQVWPSAPTCKTTWVHRAFEVWLHLLRSRRNRTLLHSRELPMSSTSATTTTRLIKFLL